MTALNPDSTEAITLGLHHASPQHLVDAMADDVAVEMGWGRLIFGQTFADPAKLAEVLRQEGHGRRDICMYAREPHVLVAMAPAELFIDPSHTYRLRFSDEDEPPRAPTGFTVRSLERREDAEEINRVYVRCGMVPAPVEVLWDNSEDRDALDYLVAVRVDDGSLVGTVTGVDHTRLFDDPENGSSLWTLAVDPTTSLPGVGAALTRALAALYRERGRSYMDLSVAHDNEAAIGLYEKLGFERVPVMAVKRKNAINEPLFTHPPETVDDLNPYARIIADEAMRRGIWVEILDAGAGEMRLSHGGRSVITRESLSEYTSAVAMARCDDKRLTRRLVSEAGIQVPKGRLATFDEHDHAFLEEVGDVVVKPTRGEQGKGITVGVSGPDELDAALARARKEHPAVLIEQRAPGDDLRLVVIDGKVVAAALRKPAEITGTGHHKIRELIEAQSRRRAAATGGESRIPVDDVTDGDRRRGRVHVRRRAARGADPACAPNGEPSSGRHDPRCDGQGEPASERGRGDGRRRHRNPRHGHRSAWFPTSPHRSTCSSKPTSVPGWPTTSPSPPQRLSSTSCSRAVPRCRRPGHPTEPPTG